MVTVEELNVIYKQYKKQLEAGQFKVVYVFILFFILFLLKLFIPREILGSSRLPHVIFFFFIGVSLILLFQVIRGFCKLERNSGYHCPGCKKQLVLRIDFIIATSACPYCGNKVVRRDESTLLTPINTNGIVKLNDFLLIARRNDKRISSLILGALFGPLIIMSIIGVLLGLLLRKLSGSQEVFDSTLAICVIIGVILMVVMLSLIKRYLKRNTGYKCPFCGKEIGLETDFLIATGACPICRKIVIDKND